MAAFTDVFGERVSRIGPAERLEMLHQPPRRSTHEVSVAAAAPYRGGDDASGGITLNSNDDGPAPPENGESDDSTFNIEQVLNADDEDEDIGDEDDEDSGDEDDEDSGDEDEEQSANGHIIDEESSHHGAESEIVEVERVSLSHRQLSLPDSGGAAESDDDDDDDDDSDNVQIPEPVRRVQRAVARRIESIPRIPESQADFGRGGGGGIELGGGGGGRARLDVSEDDADTCPLCWEEQPYIEDSETRTAMVERMSDFRRIIFRFERMMSGRQSDSVVFRGMLELRRMYIERDLERYAGDRFQRWTLEMLRRHYSPLSGHRFDIMRELDQELRDMRRQKRWVMEHAMFVTHPETGDRVFNIRAIDVSVRLAREYSRSLAQKQQELQRRNATSVADSNMVMQAINAASNLEMNARKKQRRGISGHARSGALDTGAEMYELGGL